MLRLIVFVLAAAQAVASGPASGARAATADELAMLHQVLHKTADDLRRWAYTEHRTFGDEKGRVKSETILRYDPSKPYAEQWTPLKISGREPSERDRSKYRRRGESSAPGAKPLSKATQRPTLGESINVGASTIAAETATHLTFEIPLLKVGTERFPPEKFQVQARLRKEGARLEQIAVRLRDSFRSKLVLKVKSGEATLDFAVVDPKHPPTLVSISGDASASVLFVSVGGKLDLKRTELKHVRPFDERFEVQIGTLKAIDF